MVDRLCQELGKLLIVEYFEAAATGDLADSGGVETVVIVAVATLNEDAAVTQTFSIHLSTYIVKMDSFSNVASGVLDGGVAVDIGQQTQAEAIAVVGGVGEAIHQHTGGGRQECFSHPIIQLIVHNGAPVLGFLIGHRLNIWPVADFCRHVWS